MILIFISSDYIITLICRAVGARVSIIFYAAELGLEPKSRHYSLVCSWSYLPPPQPIVSTVSL